MEDYTVILHAKRRVFRLRPFEKLWDVKMISLCACSTTIDIVARKAPDDVANVILSTPIAPGATVSLEVPIWSRIVAYQTKDHLLDFELLDAGSIVRVDLVLHKRA